MAIPLELQVFSSAYPASEFVIANTLAKWKKLEPNEINLSLGFSQKVVSTSCFVFKSLQTVWTQIKPDKMSSLIWIQIV